MCQAHQIFVKVRSAIILICVALHLKNIVMTKQEIKAGLSTGQDLFYANAGTMRCLRVAQVNYANTNDLFSSIRFEGERRFQKVPSYYLCFMKTK